MQNWQSRAFICCPYKKIISNRQGRFTTTRGRNGYKMHIRLLSITKQQTEKIYILFVLGPSRTPVPTIERDSRRKFVRSQNTNPHLTLHNKKKHAVASCPRVCTSHFNKCIVCYVAILTNIPNYRREYRCESRTHLITTPTGKFFASFFQKRREKLLLQLTLTTLQKEKI